MRTLDTDILVIGAGLAGSAYALQAASRGYRVQLLSAGDSLIANSDWAQGGIIYDRDGSPEGLIADIMAASGGTANPAAAAHLARRGPEVVESLLFGEADITFDHGPSGDLDFTQEGGHHRRRIIHSKDATGHAILERVVGRLARYPAITYRTNWVAIDLLTLAHNAQDRALRYQPSSCFGAYVLDVAQNEVVAIRARKTVLATGGLGRIFLHSTNQPGIVGHGIAMAYRAGARVMDLEFVQFHPTALYRPGAPRALVSETVRGEGAVLVNAKGEEFMLPIHPLGSLAPRDVVAQSIHREMTRSGEPCVYLSLAKMKPGFFKERFPGIYKACMDWGVDPEAGQIPVVPAAHYTCGGVAADVSGQTTLLNLRAIGETACTGLHGANRLASTSLLECLTSAVEAAEADVAALSGSPVLDALPVAKDWVSPKEEADLVLINQDMDQLRQTLWNYAGVVRSPKRLQRANAILRALNDQVRDFYRECRPSRELIELRNAVQAGLLVVHAASLNPVSEGSHCLVAD